MSKRFEEILKRLLKLTEAGKQNWQETPDETTFLTTFPNDTSLLIARCTPHWQEEPDELSEDYVRVTLLNRSGQVVEEMEGNASDWLGQLFSEARARARKRDDVLEEIWNIIGN